MTKKLLALFFTVFVTVTAFLPLSANAGFGTFSTSFGYGSSRIWFGSSYGSRYAFFGSGYGLGVGFGRFIHRRIRYPARSYSQYLKLQKKTEAMVLAKKEIYFAENIPAKDALRLQNQGIFPAPAPILEPAPKIDVDPSIHNNDPEKQPTETIKSTDGLVVVNYY